MKLILDDKSKDTLKRIKEVEYYQNIGMTWSEAFIYVNKTLPELKKAFNTRPNLILIKGNKNE